MFRSVMELSPEDVLNFWFLEVGRSNWFVRDERLDVMVRERFEKLHTDAAAQKLVTWETTPIGMLALVLLLGEFPLRMFRGTSRAFETQDDALELARTAIINHFDDRIDKQFKLFFYLPFLHSEEIGDQRLALFYIRERAKESEWLDLAERHFEIIQQFGRFPDRNTALGRSSTPDEVVFLQSH
ncbi:MAG: DUF924 domain-containing protein [Alphaproteobacteria bacterium]|nr:DUF924 domain-containing protein [Alphaproteobacteria bacterium]